MNRDIFVVVEHLRGQVAEITYMMLAAAQEIGQAAGGETVAVLLGYKAQNLSNDLAADRVLYFDHPALAEFTPDAYQKTLAGLIGEHQPRAVLLGHTSLGMDVAGGLSAQLGLPQIGQCRHIATENGRLTFISQICGGKLLARGEFPNSTTLVTMVPGGFIPEAGHSAQPPRITTLNVPPLDELRIILKQYQEPDTTDVDITKEEVLIAVGRGLQNQDDLEPAEALANALGGVVCGSRPIIDQGWLPATRLVGKSGRRVKPGLYLALGISGAPEHVEAITGSELIVAINTDPAAPIFDIAQYGIVADMFDLLEPLLEQVQAAKKG